MSGSHAALRLLGRADKETDAMPVEGRSRCGNCDGERETCELNSTLSKRPLGPVRDRADAAAAQLPLAVRAVRDGPDADRRLPCLSQRREVLLHEDCGGRELIGLGERARQGEKSTK